MVVAKTELALNLVGDDVTILYDMAYRFQNLAGDSSIAGAKDVLCWQLGLHEERRPKSPKTGVSVPTVQNDGRSLAKAQKDALTWIGHASFLVQLGGKSVLIDPVLSPRLGPGFPRNVAPGLEYSALPRIDAVLITHNHRDHLDASTLKRLGNDPIYIVPEGLGAWLKRRGHAKIVELKWWESHDIGKMNVTFVPSQHWSRRGLLDTNESWWGGYVIECGGIRLYHSGDTAWFDGFSQIGERVGPLTAAMLPIGAYAPRWFMKHQHMNPADAVRAFLALGATRFIAMHWGTFKLTDEPLDEPPLLLERAWNEAGLSEQRRTICAIGETLSFG